MNEISLIKKIVRDKSKWISVYYFEYNFIHQKIKWNNNLYLNRSLWSVLISKIATIIVYFWSEENQKIFNREELLFKNIFLIEKIVSTKKSFIIKFCYIIFSINGCIVKQFAFFVLYIKSILMISEIKFNYYHLIYIILEKIKMQLKYYFKSYLSDLFNHLIKIIKREW